LMVVVGSGTVACSLPVGGGSTNVMFYGYGRDTGLATPLPAGTRTACHRLHQILEGLHALGDDRARFRRAILEHKVVREQAVRNTPSIPST
jgi:hypothetical protein